MISGGSMLLDSQQDFLLGGWLVQPALNQISLHGKQVRLEPKVMQVLTCLARQPGKLFSKEEVIRSVWPDTFVTDQVLTHAVWLLRHAFGDTSRESQFIQTIPKGGYRLVASVAAIPDQEEQTEVPVEGAGADGPPTKHRPALWFFTGAVLVLVGLAAACYWAFWRPGPTRVERVMVAVLPFENLSGDAAEEYFSDGMTEELLTQLGHINPQRMGVIARTSAMTYKKARKSVDQIGRELRVNYVVEGSVRQDKLRVRVSAQLIAVRDQTHIWAQSYEQDRADILKLQANIAESIAHAINVAVTPGVSRRPTPTVVNPEAHRQYLLGRFFWNKRTRPGFQTARTHFEQALFLDPAFAPAYSGLADTIVLSSEPGHDLVSFEQAKALTRPLVVKALELDPDSAEAHASLAYMLQKFDRDYAGAERELRRSLELDPNYVFARHQLFGILASRGLIEEALAENRRALETDPLSPLLHGARAWVLQNVRRYDEALRESERALEVDPDFVMAHRARALLFERQGRLLDAINDYAFDDGEHYGPAKAQRRAEQSREALKKSGPSGYWAVQIKHLQEYAKDGVTVQPWYFARAYTYLGDYDRALEWLSHSDDGIRTNLLYNPDWDSLRSDPRFQELLSHNSYPR